MSNSRKASQSHMPAQSVFYDKIVPLLLAGMAILTIVVIVVAVGILVGVVPY